MNDIIIKTSKVIEGLYIRSFLCFKINFLVFFFFEIWSYINYILMLTWIRKYVWPRRSLKVTLFFLLQFFLYSLYQNLNFLKLSMHDNIIKMYIFLNTVWKVIEGHIKFLLCLKSPFSWICFCLKSDRFKTFSWNANICKPWLTFLWTTFVLVVCAGNF